MPNAADDVLKPIHVIVDELILGVIRHRTAADFRAAYDEAFPKYVDLILAFGRVVTATVPRETLSRLSAESLSELEADIREQGVASFGAEMRDRAIFTAFTLRKIAERLEQLSQHPQSPKAQEEKDVQFVERFIYNALHARFFIDCLVTSMQTRQALFPEVLPIVDNGLRAAVDAYAWIKQACDLRAPVDTREFPEYFAEEEERELLDASMADLAKDGDVV